MFIMYLMFKKCSAIAEMGDRLATIDMGRKLGGCAPLEFAVWNSLTADIVGSCSLPTFKHKLKTFLFRHAFSSS